jgi:hypothetical protein
MELRDFLLLQLRWYKEDRIRVACGKAQLAERQSLLAEVDEKIARVTQQLKALEVADEWPHIELPPKSLTQFDAGADSSLAKKRSEYSDK